MNKPHLLKILLIVCILEISKSKGTSRRDEDPILSEEFKKELNESSWERSNSLSENPFKHLTRGETKRMFQLRKSVYDYLPDIAWNIESEPTHPDLPSSFDSREKWGSCIGPIRHQGPCGSCWAISSTSALGDRICIHSRDPEDADAYTPGRVELSAEELVSCDQLDGGCEGGGLQTPYEYMMEFGVPSEFCFPYTSGYLNPQGCLTRGGGCVQETTDNKRYKCNHIKAFKSILGMKTEIYTNGPVITGFQIFEDLLYYKGGIYTHVHGEHLGGHAVKVLGWGEEGGDQYWIIANSWGRFWGDHGYFKIWMGEGSVDNYMVSCKP